MNLEDFIIEFSQVTDKQLFVALGSAVSDGSWPGYTQGDQHDFLAFVWCEELAVSSRILNYLEVNKWTTPQIKSIKLVDLPLAIPDPPFVDAFHEALRGDIGLIVYAKRR